VSLEDVWDAIVWVLSLFAAGGLAILMLSPLVFETPQSLLSRARTGILLLVTLAVLALLAEWFVLH
jgi:phosphatidylserine synthase